MSEREEGFLSGVEAAAQVCTDIADKHHKKYHEAVAGQPTHIAFGEWSGAQDCYLALAALTPPPDGAKHWLGELLAVLHRDGGHYTATHGIEKSAKDALEEITRLKVAADGAEAQANKDYADCFRIARELAKLSPGESLFDWIQARVAEHEQRPPLRKGLTMADLARLRDWKQIAATTRQLGRYDARSRVICYTAADAIEEMVAELKQLQDDNATLRAAQKACEHCDSGIAAVVEERAREIAEAMPSGMFEMSNADYWTTQINAAITLAVQQERARCMAECEQLRRDAQRYLKLRHLLIDANGVLHTALNFKGFIEIGEREIDAALDAASAEGER